MLIFQRYAMQLSLFLNWKKIGKKIFTFLISSISRPIEWRNEHLIELESYVDKIYTSLYVYFTINKIYFKDSFTYIYWGMKWKIHMMKYMENNIDSWGMFLFPCVQSHMIDIISIYWGWFHFYVICILSMKYMNDHRKITEVI